MLRPVHLARARGATPRPRSGAEAGRTPCPKGGGQEELPCVRGQGRWPRVPGCHGAGTAERSYPASKVRCGDESSCPASKVRGGSQDELHHAQCQGQWLGGATPCPRTGGCEGTGGPRGAIPHSKSGGAVVRRYPSSKVRSSGCALLDQP